MKQVESLKELNQLCQKPQYTTVGNWMVRHILRDLALPITWLLLHTSVTANQVTLFSLVIGLGGIFLFAFPPTSAFLAGALLLQFWYLLDHVDGQIARYRKTACLSGRFFDFLTHHVIHGMIFFSLGFYAFHVTGQLFFVVWGFLASMAMTFFNLTHDTKHKTFYEKLISFKAVQIQAAESAVSVSGPPKSAGVSQKVFSFLHKVSEIHVLMNILTAAALLEIALKLPIDLRFCLFVFYGLAAPLIAVTKITYMIIYRKIDQEFENQFRPVP